MFYVTVNVKDPIQVKKSIAVQKSLTTNFPDILFELHDDCKYFDLGDDCIVSASVTNTDLKTTPFQGTIEIINPHRGQIKITPVANDFTMTGINTLTVKCTLAKEVVSFQTTIFVQSILKSIEEAL